MSISGIKIVCLPCAGGSSTYFQKLRDGLSTYADMILVDYAGHGTRMDEPLNESLDELLLDVSSIIKSSIKKSDKYFILGYSMGSLLAYLLAADPKYKLNPSHLFLLAFQSPDLLKEERFLLRKTGGFEAFTKRYANIVPRIWKDKRFQDIYLKPLRNDYSMLCSCQPDLYKPLTCKITAIYGDKDFTYLDIAGWSNFTSNRTEILSLPGGHFFLNENLDTIRLLLKTCCIEDQKK